MFGLTLEKGVGWFPGEQWRRTFRAVRAGYDPANVGRLERALVLGGRDGFGGFREWGV